MGDRSTQAVDLGRPTSVRVPEHKRAAFGALTATPSFAWPTLVLAFLTIVSVLLIDVLCVMGRMPIWTGTLANILIYYFYFSVIHDGVHRAISRHKKVNDWVCQAAISTFAPYAAMPFFRWAHMEHHRFTNDHDKDPDIWSHGSPFLLPFKWMTIDIHYGIRAMRSKSPQMKKVMRDSMPFILSGIAFLIAAIVLGYGYELLMLWFIPSRLAFIGIGYAFFWLPHAHWPDEKRNLKQSDNFTIATLLRTGNERILNPLLQFQNYHLIHHLWPTTPFYNNEKLWNLLEEDIRERDIAEVHGFSAKPTYHITSSPEMVAKS